MTYLSLSSYHQAVITGKKNPNDGMEIYNYFFFPAKDANIIVWKFLEDNMDSDDILFICQHLQEIFWHEYLSITLLKSLKTKQCSGIPEHLQMWEEKN